MLTNIQAVKNSSHPRRRSMIDEQFMKRKSRSFDYGDVENYVCKFSRKVGYVGCPLHQQKFLLNVILMRKLMIIREMMK